MTSHSTPTGEKSAGLKSHDQRWIFLGIISLGLFVVGADNSVLYTALPALHVHLHTSELEGLWIINAYSLVLAGLLLGTGTLGDKIGHRRMFEIGLSVFAGASILAAVSPNADYSSRPTRDRRINDDARLTSTTENYFYRYS